MNFAELLEEVLDNLNISPGGRNVTRGDAKRLLNMANREISQKLGIPTLYLDVPSGGGFVTGPFTLPVRVQADGVKYAEVVEVFEADVPGGEMMRNRRIALLSVAEANEFHPRWEMDDNVLSGPTHYPGPPFLLHDPAMPGTGIRPVGITTARYRFLVYARPEEMVLDLDEPFSVMMCDSEGNPVQRMPGIFPDYHRLLAHHVSYELLQKIGDERWQAFYARYNAMENELFARVKPVETHLPGAINTWRPRHGERSRW